MLLDNLKSVDALIYEVYSGISQDNADKLKSGAGLLKTCLGRIAVCREDKIQKLDAVSKTRDIKDQLKAKDKLIQSEKVGETVKRWLTSLFGDQKDVVDSMMREDWRMMRMLDDIGETKTKLIEKSDDLSKVAMGETLDASSSLSEALKGQLAQQYGEQRMREQQKGSEADLINETLDRQKGGINKAESAMKKQKTLGHIFNFASIFAGSLMTALTAGAASPLGMALASASKFLQTLVPSLVQTAYTMGMQGFQSLLFKPVQNQMQDAQRMLNQGKDDQIKKMDFSNQQEILFKKSQAQSRDISDKLEKALVEGE